MEKRIGARRWRAVALLALGAVVGMMVVATPGVAHVGGTVAHMVGHMKTYFYTKPDAKKQFLRTSGNLAPGKTMRGVYWAIDDNEDGNTSIAASEISFPVPLKTAPVAHFIADGAPVPAGCSGTPREPRREPRSPVCLPGERLQHQFRRQSRPRTTPLGRRGTARSCSRSRRGPTASATRAAGRSPHRWLARRRRLGRPLTRQVACHAEAEPPERSGRRRGQHESSPPSSVTGVGRGQYDRARPIQESSYAFAGAAVFFSAYCLMKASTLS